MAQAIPCLLVAIDFPLSTKTESSSLFCAAALLAKMHLDALSTACLALSMVPDGLRWSSQVLSTLKH